MPRLRFPSAAPCICVCGKTPSPMHPHGFSRFTRTPMVPRIRTGNRTSRHPNTPTHPCPAIIRHILGVCTIGTFGTSPKPLIKVFLNTPFHPPCPCPDGPAGGRVLPGGLWRRRSARQEGALGREGGRCLGVESPPRGPIGCAEGRAADVTTFCGGVRGQAREGPGGGAKRRVEGMRHGGWEANGAGRSGAWKKGCWQGKEGFA